MAKNTQTLDYKPGQRVKVVQHGSLKFGRLTLEDNTFVGVTIVRRNDDGSYQIKGIVKTPETDEVRVPADWIEPL